MKKLLKFLKSNDGVTSIEYALIAFLLSIVIIIAVTAVGNKVLNLFNTIAVEIHKVF
jgi:pilus assembly protein Flp/PilA